MAKPIDPDHPVINPPADNTSQPADPNNGDLRYLVPEVSVQPGWNPPPSFNLDPPEDKKGGDKPPAEGPLSKAFEVDLGSVRTGEKAMMAALQTEVSEYETLRAKAMASVNSPAFFGPTKKGKTDNSGYERGGFTGGRDGGGVAPKGNATDDANEELAESAAKFAATANPAQEKLLKSIADTLELAGTFVTMLNQAGQSYSKTDRGAKFPNPPGGSPVT